MAQSQDDEKMGGQAPSCAGDISRKEFLEQVVRRAAVAGAILAAPAIVDRFLVPPVYAMPTTPIGGMETPPGLDTTGMQTDLT